LKTSIASKSSESLPGPKPGPLGAKVPAAPGQLLGRMVRVPSAF